MSLVDDPTSASAPPSASSKHLLPWLVAVAFFMESLDTTILNTAVPAISEALKVSPLSMKAVLASYTLSLAVFIPISGWVADRFGTRRVFAYAIALFTLGSLFCGISGNIHTLVACRLLQGCGGAMMVPVGRLTLVRTFAKSWPKVEEMFAAGGFAVAAGYTGKMTKPAKVDLVGVGLNATDTLIPLADYPQRGSKVEYSGATVLPGGQVANFITVVACQIWGMSTRYVGILGDDSAADLRQAWPVRGGGADRHCLPEVQVRSR